MPELPEVETIKRGLYKFIVQQKVKKIKVLCEKSFPCAVAVSGKVIDIRRFGKALVIDLDGGQSLLIHLRMTGQLIYDGDNNFITSASTNSISKNRYAAGHPSDNFIATLPNKQTRVIIYFEHGVLYFNDQRKFGFIKVIPTSEVKQDPFIKKLAPEPWDMSPDDFYNRLQRHQNSCIKAVILDQTIICGLGNIYADESLFAAGIHPSRLAGTLSKKEATNLLEQAKKVMDASIASGGSTMATYVKADGTKGDYLEKFSQVFRREGQPCPRCGHEIEKIRIAGRGTHICPFCQPITPIICNSSTPKSSAEKEAKHD